MRLNNSIFSCCMKILNGKHIYENHTLNIYCHINTDSNTVNSTKIQLVLGTRKEKNTFS